MRREGGGGIHSGVISARPFNNRWLNARYSTRHIQHEHEDDRQQDLGYIQESLQDYQQFPQVPQHASRKL